MKKTILYIISILFIFSLGFPSWGQEEIGFEEQLVYSLNIFNGQTYTQSFIPRSEDTLYILAGELNVLIPRLTQVVYSNSNAHYDIQPRNLDVVAEGNLELLQGNKIVQTIEKAPFAFYSAQSYYAGISEIYLGERAVNIFGQYQEDINRFYTLQREFSEQQSQYQRDLDEYYRKLRARKEGEKVIPPVEPLPPQSPSYFVTPLDLAFVLRLSPGEYRIRVRLEDGTIAEDSEKRLVVFEPRRQGKVGFEVIPEERWTRKENTSDSNDILYLLGRVVFYFRPFIQNEYNDLYYAKLQDPQNSGSIETWRWVNIDQVKSGLVQVLKRRDVIDRVQEMPYYVEQTPGPELGYNIINFEATAPQFAGRSPTFIGYRVDFDPSGGRYGINLLNPEDDTMIPGSFREARSVSFGPTREKVLYGISLLPLIIGIPMFIWRRIIKK